MLRALAAIGLLVEDDSRAFRLTEAGTLLNEDHPHSLKPMALLEEGPGALRGLYVEGYSRLMHEAPVGRNPKAVAAVAPFRLIALFFVLAQTPSAAGRRPEWRASL